MRIYQTEISNAYIGLQVRKRRLQMGWTAHTLGKVGIKPTANLRYERGTQNFTIHRLCIFANVLQCDLDYFLEQNSYKNLSLVNTNL
ncbi:helix-turn-helix transcriptional regulator [Providencia rettgeri]|uniref:Helix-turn-helix transcriptional regulator n=1 Tax=Providencia rettgeri TaxID=587 RepID=A0A939SQK4_PRORE|nr:helix-turn-helix transcriptional regulator [Providencia rettgeri]